MIDLPTEMLAFKQGFQVHTYKNRNRAWDPLMDGVFSLQINSYLESKQRICVYEKQFMRDEI